MAETSAEPSHSECDAHRSSAPDGSAAATGRAGRQSSTFTEEETAAVTLTKLGLRVQDVAVAQDFAGAQERVRATPIDEHNKLYQDSQPLSDHNDPPRDTDRRTTFFRQNCDPSARAAGDPGVAIGSPRESSIW